MEKLALFGGSPVLKKKLVPYNSIGKEEVVAPLPEKTPFGEHFDLFHLIHSYNKEIMARYKQLCMVLQEE